MNDSRNDPRNDMSETMPNGGCHGRIESPETILRTVASRLGWSEAETEPTTKAPVAEAEPVKVGPVVEWRGNILYVDEVVRGEVFLYLFSKAELYCSCFVRGGNKVFNDKPAPRNEAMAWCEEQLGVKSGA